MTKPKIGGCIAYYGGINPLHAVAKRSALKAGIPIMELYGCAYPEIARADALREALATQCECIVLIDPNIVFSVDDINAIANLALKEQAIVTSTLTSPVEPRGWLINGDSPQFFDASFMAVPLSVIEGMAKSDDRGYTNTAILDTVFSKDSRPFFSPWKYNPGTLKAEPIETGFYCNPDVSFLLRVIKSGFGVIRHGEVKTLGLPKYGCTIFNAGEDGKAKRKQYGIPEYAICIPTFGPLDKDQQASLWELDKAGALIIQLHNCPYIDMARAELTRIALDVVGADGIFFLDHDIIFKPTDLLSLCKEAEERQDVVAAVYCMRKTAHALIGAVDSSVGDRIPFFDIGSVLPALYSGLGFAAIPKAVIDSLREAFPAIDAGFFGKVHPLYALDVNGTFYSGEDVSFCARVQGLSVKQIQGEGNLNGHDWEIKRTEAPTKHRVWLDTRVRIFHRGAYDYGIEDHSIVVPRYAELTGELKASRAEVREFLKSAADVSSEAKIRSLGLDDGATAPHGTLE